MKVMELLENAVMKAKFVTVDLETFWLTTYEMFPLLYEKAYYKIVVTVFNNI